MGRQKTKLDEAVAVPHDGPIHAIWKDMSIDISQSKGDENHSGDGNDGTAKSVDRPGFQQALILLRTVARRRSNTEPAVVDSDRRSSSSTDRLWRTLCTSDKARDQLQALRTFRCGLLDSIQQQKDFGPQRAALEGTHRLLLELMISSQTYPALRRTVQSSLLTVQSILSVDADRIMHDIVANFWKDPWSDPGRTLQEALLFDPTRYTILQHPEVCRGCLAFVCTQVNALLPTLETTTFDRPAQTNIVSIDQDVMRVVETTVQMVTIVKLILTPILSGTHRDDESYVHYTDQLLDFPWTAIRCRSMHSDGLSKVGVVYGQLLLFRWNRLHGNDWPAIAVEAKTRLDNIIADENTAKLNILAAVVGISALLPNGVLQHTVADADSPVLQNPVADFLLQQCNEAIDPPTRLAALRGLTMLLNRCAVMGHKPPCVDRIVQQSLELVLQTWENPPVKQVACAVPSLFKSLMPLLQTTNDVTSQTTASPRGIESGMEALVKRILAQPLNRKVSSRIDIVFVSVRPQYPATCCWIVRCCSS